MTKQALLVGINDYIASDVPDLRGCVNDVASLREFLIGPGGFREHDITVLIDGDATGENIRTTLGDLFSTAKAGDTVLFAYSGHGSYVPDEDGDESDGRDEVICAADMDWHDPKTFLRDDEIRRCVWSVAADVTVRVILDSCHSGTASRALGPPRTKSGARCLLEATARRAGTLKSLSPHSPQFVHSRFAAPPMDIATKAVRRKHRKRDVIPQTSDILVLAACRDDQESADYFSRSAGRYHGAHTRGLCDVLDRVGPAIDRGMLLQKVRESVKAGGFGQLAQMDVSVPQGPFL